VRREVLERDLAALDRRRHVRRQMPPDRIGKVHERAMSASTVAVNVLVIEPISSTGSISIRLIAASSRSPGRRDTFTRWNDRAWLPCEPMAAIWTDPRVMRGTERMLAARMRAIEAGERPIGWKLAFGAAAAQQSLQIDAPLVAGLMAGGVLASGATVSVEGWTKPALEPELALHLAADVPAGASREEAAGAVGAVGAAIEVLDFDRALAAPALEDIVADGIFHRHVLLGPADPARAGLRVDGLSARVLSEGELIAATDDPQAACGELVGLVQHVAALLAATGEGLRRGDVVISGSLTPLVWLDPPQEIAVELSGLGALRVGFRAA
jgi:2-keto-4-pentenoate hydratase